MYALDVLEPVRFVVHNGNEVRGLHPQIKKIAFVTKFYRGVKPKAGEEWRCQIVKDTRPDTVHLGVLFLSPMTKLGRHDVWSVRLVQSGKRAYPLVVHEQFNGDSLINEETIAIDDRSKINATWPADVLQRVETELQRKPESKFQVTVSVDNGKVTATVTRVDSIAIFKLDTQEVVVEDKSQIDPMWPMWVIYRISAAFLGLDYARQLARQQESEAARRVEETTTPALAAQRIDAAQTALIPRLVNPVTVTVEDVITSRHALALIDLPNDPDGLKAITLDGELIGLGRKNPVGFQYPCTVETRTITLSNGEIVTISSLSLEVISHVTDTWCSKRWTVFSNGIQVRVKDRSYLTWKEASAFAVGDVFAQEFAFQWVDDWLTTGVVWFPRERPFGSQWRHYPIPTIPEECWEMFLSGLQGKLLDSLIPFHRQVTTKPKTHRETLTPKQRQIAAVINGQMFQGSEEGCDHVGVGRNMVFTKTRPGRSTIYIVDNPGIGALFLFTNKAEAMRLASGEVLRSEVTTHVGKIVHIDGWQEKLAEALATID